MTQDEVFEALDLGILYVVFDPRSPDVDVPPQFRNQDRLTLKFSVYYEDQVEVDAGYISQILSFGGHEYLCRVPLAAIEDWRIDDHEFQAAPVPTAPKLRLVEDS